MRRFLYTGLAVLVAVGMVFPALAMAEAPHEIAGFTLGKNISQYRDRLRMKTAMPVRDMEYLSEVDVVPPPGFKSGQVEYGNCEHPGRIVKISMKYLDPSKELFEKLLARFKDRFGEPAEWRGDPFHVYIAWKWSLIDKNNNRVSMILQHYRGDEDVYKNGNSVKLSMFGLIEQEEKCYEKKHPQPVPGKEAKQGAEKKVEVDFDQLIPKP